MSTTTPLFTPSGHDVSFGGALRSEWIKLRSIRSTWWCFAILVILTVGFGALLSATVSTEFAPPGFDTQALSTQAVTVGVAMSALVVSVLGVLIISGEYGTGMIRSTLTAVPSRWPALLAKALVFAVVTLVVSAIAFAVTVPISAALLSGNGIDTDLGDADYWLALLGAIGYLVAIGLIAFSIGAIVRSTAGALAIALGMLLALPLVVTLVGSLTRQQWLQNVGVFLPDAAGGRLYAYPAETVAADGAIVLDPLQGALVLAAWVVGLFAIAVVLIRRRDA